MEERLIAILAERIDQGCLDGAVRPDIDAQAMAEFLMNTNTGLRIRARTHEAPALCRIIDIALTTL